MQRLSYKLDPNIEYECDLCKMLFSKEEPIIWESSWLLDTQQEKLKPLIKPTIDWNFIDKMPPIISQNEVDDFTVY